MVFSMLRLLLLVFVLVPVPGGSAKADFPGFKQWLVKTGEEAEARGISRKIIDLAVPGREQDQRAISLVSQQLELARTF